MFKRTAKSLNNYGVKASKRGVPASSFASLYQSQMDELLTTITGSGQQLAAVAAFVFV